MKTITIEYNGLETSIKWSDDVTPIEALGMLRYHEKNVFAGLLKYNEEKNKKKEREQQQVYIKDMDLSVRTKNCLLDNKIYTLKDLEQLTDRDLLRIRNFGNKCLSELQYVLKNLNK
jgi:DNA-directed RNA polymerase subunit alpha